MKLELEIIEISKPEECNIIVGQAHFIKTVEDIYEVIVSAVPHIRFAVSFCEASGKCLVRTEGTDEELKKIAIDNALRVGCGHSFFVILKDSYPINVLNQIKNVSEVCRIFCATANPVQVIIARTDQGRSLLGVVDGFSPQGIEGEEDIQDRKELLRKFGYKL